MFTLLGPSIKLGKNIHILRKDFEDYCKCRNQATKATRFARKRYEQGIAENIKENGKAFWSYVNSKTKVISGIGDLRDSDGD